MGYVLACTKKCGQVGAVVNNAHACEPAGLGTEVENIPFDGERE